MAKVQTAANARPTDAQPRLHQHAGELQVWFPSEHMVNVPLVEVREAAAQIGVS